MFSSAQANRLGCKSLPSVWKRTRWVVITFSHYETDVLLNTTCAGWSPACPPAQRWSSKIRCRQCPVQSWAEPQIGVRETTTTTFVERLNDWLNHEIVLPTYVDQPRWAARDVMTNESASSFRIALHLTGAARVFDLDCLRATVQHLAVLNQVKNGWVRPRSGFPFCRAARRDRSTGWIRPGIPGREQVQDSAVITVYTTISRLFPFTSGRGIAQYLRACHHSRQLLELIAIDWNLSLMKSTCKDMVRGINIGPHKHSQPHTDH